jgi:hypothetical protein
MVRKSHAEKRLEAALRVPDEGHLDPAPRSPMSAVERQLLLALSECHFHSDSADARFCHDLAVAADSEHGYALTEGQRAYLKRLGQRYYRQLPAEIFALLEDPSPAIAIARARARFIA